MTDTFYIDTWPVFYEDNHLLALYKPAGLLVQADKTKDPSLLELARSWIKERYGKPGNVYLGLVHRLDRPVAGIMLFARTSKAAGRLSEQFRNKSVEKTYAAVVEGSIRQPAGRLVHHLERVENRSSRLFDAPTEKSRKVCLSFRLLDTENDRSLVSIDLETGGHHQIRAQFAHIGHPVLGDLRYGAKEALPGKPIALFASRISIFHPTLRTPLTLSSPYPAGWPWPGAENAPGAPPWNWSSIKKRTDLF
jgi:23S rRNA pseudouridine1911/1915/1917 synthase